MQSPIAKARETVAKELGVPAGAVGMTKRLADRLDNFFLTQGRVTARRSATGESTGTEVADVETATTVRVSEEPRLLGRLPASWPRTAIVGKPPVQVLTPDLKSFKMMSLAAVNTDMTPGGTTQVWAYWVAPWTEEETTRRIRDDIGKGSGWSEMGPRFMPTDRSSKFGWISLHSYYSVSNAGDISKKSIVEVSYVAPGVPRLRIHPHGGAAR